MIPVKDKDGKYGQTNDGNPIAWLDSGQTVDNCNQNFTGALSVDYDIIDGLKATVTGAYVNEDQRHTERVLTYRMIRHLRLVPLPWLNVS